MNHINKYAAWLVVVLLTACAGLMGPNLRPGETLTAEGDHKGALEYYQTLIEEGKTSSKLYRNAYESAFRSGNRSTASGYYETALELGYDADSLKTLATELWYERAVWLMGAGKWEAAKKSAAELNRIAKGSNEEKFCTLILAGKSKFDRGAHKGLWDALADYGKAANYDASSGLPYFLSGQARYKNNKTDFDAALEDYRMALEIEPDGPFATTARADIKKIEAVKKKMNSFWGK